MTRFGHKLNYVINTFVKHTPELHFVEGKLAILIKIYDLGYLFDVPFFSGGPRVFYHFVVTRST